MKYYTTSPENILTLAVPDELRKRMKRYPDIRWSEVARKSIAERLESLRIADELAKKSKLTMKDVWAFDKLVKKAAAKRFRAL